LPERRSKRLNEGRKRTATGRDENRKMSAEQLYTRAELFTRQRLMIWSAALVVALGVGGFTIVIGRKEVVAARAQKEAEQERLASQRAVEEKKAQHQRAQAEQGARQRQPGSMTM
jgi:uncharacterized protein HemX